MSDSSIALNLGSGGANVATVLDGSSLQHQKVVLEQEISSLPVAVSTSNPLAVAQTGTANVAGPVASASSNSTNPVKVGAAYNTSAPTYTNGTLTDLQADASGNLKVNVVAGGGAGGTSSTVNSAVPTIATAIGFSDGTNLQLGKVDGSGNVKVNIAAGGVPASQDNSSFTAGSTQGLATVLVFNDGVSALTSTNQGVVRGTSDRKMYVAAGAFPTGGWTPSTPIVVTSTTPAQTTIKGSAGTIGSIQAVNFDPTNWAYLKIFNATSATLGTTVAAKNIPLPPNGGVVVNVPVSYSTGIIVAVTGSFPNNDNTALGTANKQVINIDFN